VLLRCRQGNFQQPLDRCVLRMVLNGSVKETQYALRMEIETHFYKRRPNAFARQNYTDPVKHEEFAQVIWRKCWEIILARAILSERVELSQHVDVVSKCFERRDGFLKLLIGRDQFWKIVPLQSACKGCQRNQIGVFITILFTIGARREACFPAVQFLLDYRFGELRVVHRLKVTAIRAEGFMYPHAAITAVTLELGGEATIPETADGITALAEAPVMVQGVETRLSQMAERVARHVRESCGFGVVTAVSKSSRFRLFSVINGTGGTEAPAANAPEWAALQGISSLRRDWATIPPPSPGNILKLSFGTPKLAHFNKDAVSYILASNFASSPGKSNSSTRPSNSCYHRNQVLLAAHLFALIPLVRWARPHLVTHDTPVEVDRLAPAAASTIVDLRGRDAYRSALTTPLATLLDPDNEVGAVANAG